MTGLVADRVQETSSTAGTGAITLAGATLPSMNTFASAFTNGALVGYVVLNQAVQTEWEKGIGTYSANSIARTYVTGGSNGTSPVDFSAGTKLVMSVAPQTQQAQTYSATQVYAPGDTAQSGGSTWYALAVNVGSAPSASNANWTTLGGTGTQGPPGPAATIAVGTTTTLAPGSSATVSNAGTSSAAIFDFGIPQGETGATGSTGPQGNTGATGATGPAGAAATVTIGTTSTLPPGSSATVSNSGSSSAAVFNFGIPQGPTGTVTPDYIFGLRLSYVDATHVQIGTGAASRQSDGSLITLSTAVSVNILSGGTQFWHLYLASSGTPNVVASSTPPTAPYFGTARSGATTTQRYVGSVLVVSGAVVPFTMIGTKMRYLTNPSVAPFRVLSGGTATTSATIDLSGVLPATARIAHARLLNNATAGQVYIGNPDMGAASYSNYMTTARATSEFESELLTDASQAINYIYNASPGAGCNIDVNGYEFER